MSRFWKGRIRILSCSYFGTPFNHNIIHYCSVHKFSTHNFSNDCKSELPHDIWDQLNILITRKEIRQTKCLQFPRIKDNSESFSHQRHTIIKRRGQEDEDDSSNPQKKIGAVSNVDSSEYEISRKSCMKIVPVTSSKNDVDTTKDPISLESDPSHTSYCQHDPDDDLNKGQISLKKATSISEVIDYLANENDRIPTDTLKKSPAHIFFEENRKELIKRAETYYLEKGFELEQDYKYDYSHQPVLHKLHNSYWNMNKIQKSIVLEKGILPALKDFIEILKTEGAYDIILINLDDCGRRDIGLYSIICTCKNQIHCKRISNYLYKMIRTLEIPFISESSSMVKSQSDDWHYLSLGSLSIHLMTPETRELYNLENLWLQPQENFRDETFPAYFDKSYNVPPAYIVRNSIEKTIIKDKTYEEFKMDCTTFED